MIVLWLTCVSYALAIGLLPIVMYLAYLACMSRMSVIKNHQAYTAYFTCVVPAHNEEKNIAGTIKSLKEVYYPTHLRRIVVVADNCTDQTADIAKREGADVLIRNNATLRGKGYALRDAFETIMRDGITTAIVVVDADSIVSKNMLQVFSGILARGEKAIQANYGVRNPYASWRTRLMVLALAMFHRLRSLARERLHVSVGLRGNGMCFSCVLLREHPHAAFGIVEDVEYSLQIGRAGVRVAYADKAEILGEMATSAASSVTQRKRWEGGRMQLLKKNIVSLLMQAWRDRSMMLFDLAMDLIVPPLGYIGLLLFVGVALALPQAQYMSCLNILWLIHMFCMMLYIVRGIFLSNLGFSAVTTLLWAPIYVVWKLALIGKHHTGGWVRTKRENEI